MLRGQDSRFEPQGGRHRGSVLHGLTAVGGRAVRHRGAGRIRPADRARASRRHPAAHRGPGLRHRGSVAAAGSRRRGGRGRARRPGRVSAWAPRQAGSAASRALLLLPDHCRPRLPAAARAPPPLAHTPAPDHRPCVREGDRSPVSAPTQLPGFLQTLAPLLDRWGYLAIAFLLFVEDFGVPAPGETVLIAASVYAGAGRLNIVAVGIISLAAAVLGDNVGYAIGRFGGRELAVRFGRYVMLTEQRLEKAEAFFNRHGGKIV